VILENHELPKDSWYPGWHANRDLNAECSYSAQTLHQPAQHSEEWRCTTFIFLYLPQWLAWMVSCTYRSFYARRQTPAWTSWQTPTGYL